MTRGFEYDRLTEADDAHVDAVRVALFACPCGMGWWVSVKTGYIYRGHGGSEREQWSLQKEGPWIRLDDGEVREKLTGPLEREAETAKERAQAVLDGIRQVVDELG